MGFGQVFGRYDANVHLLFLRGMPTGWFSVFAQNTEDEVLKAAIAKYGKNQWCAVLIYHEYVRH